MSSKETFTDNSQDLLRGLTHIDMAKQYLEMVMAGRSKETKYVFQQPILKLKWILNYFFDKLGEQSRKDYKEILTHADTLFTADMAELLPLVPNDKKELLTVIIKGIIRGEEIKLVDDNQLIPQTT